MFIIRAGQLLDGKSDKSLKDMGIVVDGKHIQSVTPFTSLVLEPNVLVLDGTRFSVIPGMVDCHVHIHSPGGSDREYNYSLDSLTQLQGTLALRSFNHARKDLAMGFTTLRSLDSPAYVDVALRNAIQSGLVEGPRLHVAGQGISVSGGHMDKAWWSPDVSVSGRTAVGDGPWGCRKAARDQLKRGVDVLKINACGGLLDLTEPWHQEMTYEEMAAVCAEARGAKKRVAAHTSGGPGISDAIQAGVNSIEHGPWLTDEQLEKMVAGNVFYVPTLTTNAHGVAMGREEILSDEAEWAWLLKVDEDKWNSLERARKIGVQVAVGTDAGFWVHHGENATELEQLVIGGYSAMQAIHSATRVGAACLGLEKEIGTIEVGKLADLVLVDGDPLVDVRILQEERRIVSVYKEGILVAGKPPAVLSFLSAEK